MKYRRIAATALAGAAALTSFAATGSAAATGAHHPNPAPAHHHRPAPAFVQVLSPRPGDRTGVAGTNWVVDFNAVFPTGTSGYTTAQLTGPGAHADAAPLPGSFGPGRDEHLPGVVVLASTTTAFSGAGTNLANLFNITALTDTSRRTTTVQDTWIVGAPLFGTDVASTLTIAVVADLDHNGVYDDAPATVPDAGNDNRVDAADLRQLGVASNIATIRFHINGDVTP
ncbi:MAG: hypothetical protein GEV28_20750 [Actinophytocola sp.]|uniref:hypothetical protein n=1 Tax=Actinophytocola sp. TaxID=1872138 RepID=UPI001320955C|nr:hypothetical protein [Actinophytocola sp.]MPZ82694.1 hypothetical protein [Actinophytocola sp.]